MNMTCAGCEKPPRTPRSKWCTEVCRKATERRGKPAGSAGPSPSTAVADALKVELTALKVIETYEATIAIGIARQLDDGTARGAAYVSLSKELDRKVDALRLKADLPDDPARVAADAVAAKRAALRAV